MWAKQAVKATPSSAYSMQKVGLHSLTQHLAIELADHNIRVNAVSPTVVDTPYFMIQLLSKLLNFWATSFHFAEAIES